MMHWNENADRGQAIKTDGTPMYKITYPKAKAGGHTVSEVLTNCTFSEYFHTISVWVKFFLGKQQQKRLHKNK